MGGYGGGGTYPPPDGLVPFASAVWGGTRKMSNIRVPPVIAEGGFMAKKFHSIQCLFKKISRHYVAKTLFSAKVLFI